MATVPAATPRYALVKKLIRLKIFIIAALLAVPLFTASTATVSHRKSNNATIKTSASQSTANRNVSEKSRVTDSRLLKALGIGSYPPSLMLQAGIENVAIFEGDCETPATSVSTGATVCAKLTNAPTGFRATQVLRRLAIVGPNGFVRSQSDVSGTSSEATLSFTIPAADTSVIGGETVDNRGTWYATSVTGSDGGVVAKDSFTVTSTEVVSDLLLQSAVDGNTEISAGDTVSFNLYLTNKGPNTAEGVSVTNDIPANTSFVSATSSDASFTCNNTAETVTCDGGSLADGALAKFTITLTVSSGAAVGTTVVNVANVTSTTAQRTTNYKTTESAVVVVGAAAPGTCTLTCPANKVVTADTTVSGNFGAFVSYGAAAGDGDCGTITNSPASGSFFAVGTHTVTSTAASGGSCTFTVKVLGTAAPTISCPANKSFASNGVDGFTSSDPATDIGTPSFTTANTGTLSFLRSDSTPPGVDENGDPTPGDIKTLSDPFPFGITGITWTVTDADGRTASCLQTIFVQETARDVLTITCPANVSAQATGGCGSSANVSLGTPTTNPNDSHVTAVATRSDGNSPTDPYPVGTTTVTWTATDDLTGNVASCTQLVTVTAAGDTTPPTFDSPPVNVSASTSTCSIVLDDELGVVTATDTCGAVNVSRSGVPANFVFPTGTTIITYTATDPSGNTATATQTVFVAESPAVPPTITAPANVTVNTGPGATSCDTVVSNATLGTATGSDNCGPVTITRSPSGNTFAVGTTTVVWTATDRAGNTATANQTVTVIDNTPPIVTAPAAVTLYTGPGATSCGVTVANLDATLGTGSATDNCPGVGAVSRSGVPSGNVFPVGTTTLTYSATDAHGNSASAQQVVTVIDNTAPVISCPANIVLEPTCPSGAVATFANATATDNCGVQSVNRTGGPASGSVFPIGTTIVTFTATDIYGNTASCSFTVTVKTVLQTLDDLRAAVNANTELSGPQRNGLLAKLDAARQAIVAGNQNAACAKLLDFINSTQNFIDHGDLSAATGNAWISTASHIRNAIGCTSLPCS